MGKIGRNELCPCNSGQKYKRCCLGKPPLASDLLSQRVHQLFKNNFRTIVATSERTRLQLNASIRETFQSVQGDADTVSGLLSRYVNCVEGECAALLERHDPIFWLSLDRRFPPWLSRGAASKPSQQTLLRDLSIAKTGLFFKHGSKQPSKMEFYLDQTFGFEVSDQDIIELFGKLYTLVDEIINLQSLYRRVNKGAKLEIGNGGELVAEPDEELGDLMCLYDSRRQQFSTSFSPIGFASAYDAVQKFPSLGFAADQWTTVEFEQNIDPNYVYQIGEIARIKGPGFLPYEISLRLLAFIEPFEERVETVTGLTLRQLRLCFVALKNYFCDRWFEEGAQFTYLGRGLMFAERDFFIEKLTEQIQSLFQKEGEVLNASEGVRHFLELLASRDASGTYDPLTPGNISCLHEQQNMLLLDLNLIMAPLMNLMMNLQLDNEMRQIKGSQFEAYVANRLREDCPEIAIPIKAGLKLKRQGEQNPFAELDAYVQAGPLLFLVECKSYSLTREYFRGDAKSARNRRILNEQWLEASDKRACQIAEQSTGSNYAIPNEVTHLIPVVCSAFPEFCWTYDEHFFLVPKTIPRVCTYHELAELLTNTEILRSLHERPFAVPLNHPPRRKLGT